MRSAAALSLLSYPVDQTAPVMKANLTSNRPQFVNALASADPEPYVAMLDEVRRNTSTATDRTPGAQDPFFIDQE